MSELIQAFGLDVRILLIQALNFGILLFVLWRYLYTPVFRMIDERRAKIAEGVQKAEAADRRLSEARDEGSALVAEASREAEELVSAARTRADSEAKEILERTQVRADALLKEAAEKAEEEKRQALIAGEKEITRAALLAAEKILAEKAA
jgi:F-type H+-transporting ATPase subunit b